jgi:hypothetical protein
MFKPACIYHSSRYSTWTLFGLVNSQLTSSCFIFCVQPLERPAHTSGIVALAHLTIYIPYLVFTKANCYRLQPQLVTTTGSRLNGDSWQLRIVCVSWQEDEWSYRKKIQFCLKGQCHKIFCFCFFSWISFPQASDYNIRAVLNFFENSRRYSQLKVCHRCQRHRWQMAKTFKQKNFNNFVWTPLGCRVNIYINFCLQVHFKLSAAWYCCHYLPPVSTTLAKMVEKFATCVADTGGKFATGVVDIGGCRWYRWCTLTREYLREFLNKFETV